MDPQKMKIDMEFFSMKFLDSTTVNSRFRTNITRFFHLNLSSQLTNGFGGIFRGAF